MEENESGSILYLVPANVSARFEFIDGFGWRELQMVLIAVLFGVGLYMLTGLIPKPINTEDKINSEQVVKNEMASGQAVDIDIEQAEQRVPLIPNPVRVLVFIVIPGAGVFIMVRRNPTSGLSLMQFVLAMKDFNRRQKLYLYKYGSGAEG